MKKIYFGITIVFILLLLLFVKTNSYIGLNVIKQIESQTIADVKKEKIYDLSDKELEKVKLLIQLMRSAESVSISTHIGEGKILKTGEEQFEFIKALNERDKTELN